MKIGNFTMTRSNWTWPPKLSIINKQTGEELHGWQVLQRLLTGR